jgi:hypothetical protein
VWLGVCFSMSNSRRFEGNLIIWILSSQVHAPSSVIYRGEHQAVGRGHTHTHVYCSRATENVHIASVFRSIFMKKLPVDDASSDNDPYSTESIINTDTSNLVRAVGLQCDYWIYCFPTIQPFSYSNVQNIYTHVGMHCM